MTPGGVSSGQEPPVHCGQSVNESVNELLSLPGRNGNQDSNGASKYGQKATQSGPDLDLLIRRFRVRFPEAAPDRAHQIRGFSSAAVGEPETIHLLAPD